MHYTYGKEETAKALPQIIKYFKDNGRIILTVPAYQSLFSKHDKELKHFRRYNKKIISINYRYD